MVILTITVHLCSILLKAQLRIISPNNIFKLSFWSIISIWPSGQRPSIVSKMHNAHIYPIHDHFGI